MPDINSCAAASIDNKTVLTINNQKPIYMPTLYKRQKYYYIVFSKRDNGVLKQRKFSLKTRNKKIAESKLIKLRESYERGEIDPFNGWSPGACRSAVTKSDRVHSTILQSLAEEFVKNRTTANVISKDNYRRHLNMFMKQVGKTMPVSAITAGDIKEFCFKPTLKPATQASYLRHLKAFFNWLHQEQIVTSNVTRGIEPPRVPKNILGKIFKEGEIESTLTAYEDYNRQKFGTPKKTRPELLRFWFKPLIWTTYYCGLRASEVVSLRWEDIDFEAGSIQIINSDHHQTKSGEDRIIPIRKPLIPILRRWHQNQNAPSSGFVFPSVKNPKMSTRMCKGAVSKTFKKFIRLAGLPETRNLHGLRHTCATELIKKNLALPLVKDFLGHKSLKVTLIYLHLDKSDLKKAIGNIE